MKGSIGMVMAQQLMNVIQMIEILSNAQVRIVVSTEVIRRLPSLEDLVKIGLLQSHT
jgi:hypothetical protein